mgnify:CR=1 FL=1
MVFHNATTDHDTSEFLINILNTAEQHLSISRIMVWELVLLVLTYVDCQVLALIVPYYFSSY